MTGALPDADRAGRAHQVEHVAVELTVPELVVAPREQPLVVGGTIHAHPLASPGQLRDVLLVRMRRGIAAVG
ncbi:hypothetical protein [Ilumatobacter sp.]|uniref:hypothetical protein n=1 Tax=Ilumatobacter sp. TaxID=1967498 RepID=UPI003753A482